MLTLWRGLVRRMFSALRVLLLPGDHMPVTRAELAQFEARMSEWELVLANHFEKLSMWSARQAKREQRAADASLTGQAPPQEVAPESPKDRKRALYRRVAGARGAPLELLEDAKAGIPPPPPNRDDDE